MTNTHLSQNEQTQNEQTHRSACESKNDFVIAPTSAFVMKNLMGPNVVRMFTELCGTNDSFVSLGESNRICDLGCGAGLSSLAIAEACKATVFAVDSWNAPEDNRQRFDRFSFGSRIEAIQADAPDLPFDSDYFDALICLDSYNYFGREEGVIDRVASYVKPGGKLFLGISGVKGEPTLADLEVFNLSWSAEQMDYIKSLEWWRDLLAKSKSVRIEEITEMSCHKQAWLDWLTCENEYAQSDRAACDAGAIDLMCTIGIVLTRLV